MLFDELLSKLGSVGNILKSALGNSANIKFDADRIADAASTMDIQYNKYIQNIENINNCVNKLKSSWNGASAEIYYKRVEELNLQASEVAKTFFEYKEDVKKAAGIYSDVEIKVETINEGLPIDSL